MVARGRPKRRTRPFPRARREVERPRVDVWERARRPATSPWDGTTRLVAVYHGRRGRGAASGDRALPPRVVGEIRRFTRAAAAAGAAGGTRRTPRGPYETIRAPRATRGRHGRRPAPLSAGEPDPAAAESLQLAAGRSAPSKFNPCKREILWSVIGQVKKPIAKSFSFQCNPCIKLKLRIRTARHAVRLSSPLVFRT